MIGQITEDLPEWAHLKDPSTSFIKKLEISDIELDREKSKSEFEPVKKKSTLFQGDLERMRTQVADYRANFSSMRRV